MSPQYLILAATAGAVCLAIFAVLSAWATRRTGDARAAALAARLAAAERRARASQASAEAFDTALVAIEDGRASLITGEDSLAACGAVLGVSQADTQAVVDALAAADPEHARRLTGLFERGEPCAFEARGLHGGVSVEGRAAGLLAWLRLSPIAGAETGLPTAARLAAFIDARRDPAWIAAADGAPMWVNRSWLRAVGVDSLEAAVSAAASLDRAIDALVREAATAGERRQGLRWASQTRGRRAFRVTAQPLEGGGGGVWTEDATEAEA